MLFGKELRKSFPIFNQTCCAEKASDAAVSVGKTSKPLCYLDSAASAQKPSDVIKTLIDYLSFQHANVHRGAYKLSAEATIRFENVRKIAAGFINAGSERNVIFTKGATDSINLAAYSIQDYFSSGDTVLLSYLEHHSNIVPWQILAQRKKLNVAFTDIKNDGQLDLNDFKNKISTLKPRVVSITALANSLGVITPVEELVEIAKKAGSFVLLDASQYSAHRATDVQKLDCDFLAFSAHKLYGPTGAGLLYCSDRALEVMQPVYGGGEMISTVTTEGSTWAEIPYRFEAGTPAIAEVIAMGTALQFLADLFRSNIHEFEKKLFQEFYHAISEEPGIRIYGPGPETANHCSIISFNLEGVHPHDLASVADSFNVQIRAGHHCAQPLMKRLGVNATARASLACYSDTDQIEPLIEAIRYARKVFA